MMMMGNLVLVVEWKRALWAEIEDGGEFEVV
jgi:hypothetical protein